MMDHRAEVLGALEAEAEKPEYHPDRCELVLRMTLLSDTIFGNGMSVPGEEDISLLTDAQGFPFYKGSTFKGVFREEMERLLEWGGEGSSLAGILFGEPGFGKDTPESEDRRLVFSDFKLSPFVRERIAQEIGNLPDQILDCLTNMRAFTRISEQGTADRGSLRYARCVNRGLIFYGTLGCACEDESKILEALKLVKWIGTLRNRGFGNVRVEIEKRRDA